jgi:DNA-damage-inducible protein D
MTQRREREAARQTPPEHNESNDVAIGAQESVTFEPTGQQVRRIPRDGEWYYAIDDLLTPLLPAEGMIGGWDELRARLRADGFRQLDARVVEMNLTSEDGQARPTRVANAATLLRLLAAVSGPAAEAGKEWLARAGAERMREEEDPAIAVERARRLYARQGYSREWTQRRLQGITLRQRLAQEWAARGAREGADYAALTDALSQGAFGMPVEAHKAAKGLKSSQSLRDSMTTMELLLTNLVEETALTLSQARDSQGIEALLRDTQEASAIGGATRQAIEARIGRTLVTPANFRALRQGHARRHSRVYLGPPLAQTTPPAPAEPAAQPTPTEEQPDAAPPTVAAEEQPASDATI